MALIQCIFIREPARCQVSDQTVEAKHTAAAVGHDELGRPADFKPSPHLHFLVTEGGVDEAGIFHKIPQIDDLQLEELFAREVLSDLVRKELLIPEWTERGFYPGGTQASQSIAWFGPRPSRWPSGWANI
ncbi:MAG: hypothetical protein A2Y69_03020 [Candidatus Aminicenantes bacterium RBG_13_59_9]|nr:MAG: hypothetical protein A2Y69_03020 [Candidatus Aminicenantes bacterium RBG_13_59_9]